jgi:L-serine deaminase
MRAGAIFTNDLSEAGLLDKVEKIRISLYGSLAATGNGHMTPSALLLGLEGADCETIDTASVPIRFESIKENKRLHLGGGGEKGGGKQVTFDYEKDFIFEYGRSLPLHSNGMRLTVFDGEGTMLATNDLFSVGGGFVINGALSTAATARNKSTSTHPVDLAENLFYKEIKRSNAPADRRTGSDPTRLEENGVTTALLEDGGNEQSEDLSLSNTNQKEDSLPVKTTISTQPPYPFRDAKSMLALCKKHNLTIAQLVYENERHWYTDEEIRRKLTNIWLVMDNCIREGVHSDQELLPGSLKMKRRAPALYRRLTRGLYPSLDKPSSLKSTSQSIEAAGDASSSSSELKRVDAEKSERRLSINPTKGPPRVHGSFHHPILPTPPRRNMFPTMDHLTVYAMAVNEVNAGGGRVVTAPTNGAVS